MDIAGEIWLDDRLHYIISAPDETSEGEPSNLPHVLTRREIQIIMLVAEGCVNKQIADRLRISEWTVSTHMRRIFAKLGVDSRAAMVFHCAKRLGLSSGS
jgi:DNA-binding CsgD family transcriptional regulator